MNYTLHRDFKFAFKFNLLVESKLNLKKLIFHISQKSEMKKVYVHVLRSLHAYARQFFFLRFLLLNLFFS